MADDQAEERSDQDRGQRDERRLDQEAQLDHPPPEPDRAQDPDLLPPFDDGASADHAKGCDADDQAETHEALDQPVERPARGDGVLEQLVERVGLDTVREERRLDLPRLGAGVDAGREVEVEDRRPTRSPKASRSVSCEVVIPAIASGA